MTTDDTEDERSLVMELGVLADDAGDPPQACLDFAIRACKGAGDVTIDPALLWLVARIVASIVIKCADARLAVGLDRIKRHPHGFLARSFRAGFEDRLVSRGRHRDEARRVAAASLEVAADYRSTFADTWDAAVAAFRP